MAGNRKNQSASVTIGLVVKVIMLCVAVGGAGVGYVSQKNSIYQLGRQISEREMLLKKLRVENEKMRRQLAMLQTPQFIEQRIKELNLGLAQPQPGQVWRLVEPSAETPGVADVPHETQVASRNQNSVMP